MQRTCVDFVPSLAIEHHLHTPSVRVGELSLISIVSNSGRMQRTGAAARGVGCVGCDARVALG